MINEINELLSTRITDQPGNDGWLESFATDRIERDTVTDNLTGQHLKTSIQDPLSSGKYISADIHDDIAKMQQQYGDNAGEKSTAPQENPEDTVAPAVTEPEQVNFHQQISDNISTIVGEIETNILPQVQNQAENQKKWFGFKEVPGEDTSQMSNMQQLLQSNEAKFRPVFEGFANLGGAVQNFLSMTKQILSNIQSLQGQTQQPSPIAPIAPPVTGSANDDMIVEAVFGLSQRERDEKASKVANQAYQQLVSSIQGIIGSLNGLAPRLQNLSKVTKGTSKIGNADVQRAIDGLGASFDGMASQANALGGQLGVQQQAQSAVEEVEQPGQEVTPEVTPEVTQGAPEEIPTAPPTQGVPAAPIGKQPRVPGGKQQDPAGASATVETTPSSEATPNGVVALFNKAVLAKYTEYRIDEKAQAELKSTVDKTRNDIINFFDMIKPEQRMEATVTQMEDENNGMKATVTQLNDKDNGMQAKVIKNTNDDIVEFEL